MINVIAGILSNLKNSFIQEVPNELYACLNCNHVACVQEKWESCNHRIDSELYLDQEFGKKKRIR